jgi:hypothetical protein
MNRDSRTFRGKRRVAGGRGKVRAVLYMSMWSTIQYDPKIKSMYERLVKPVSQESSPGSLYAQAADYPEYDDEERYSLG